MSCELIFVLLSPFVGSFVGVLVKRLPHDQPVVWGRSQCEACERRLTAFELVPVASWIFQRGKCRSCATQLGFFYPGVELAAFAIALLSALMLEGPAMVAGCVLGWLLLALALIDLEHLILPDALTAPLLVAGLLAGIWISREALVQGVIGATAGFLSFAAVRHIYFQVRSREGMGFGDVKLLGAGGAWLGWQGLPYAVLIAAGTALVATRIRNGGLAHLSPRTRIPFGAYLAAGIWLAWLFMQRSFFSGSFT